jgi:hypothetical protein
MTTTKVNLANTVEGILPVANGGTGTSTGVAPGGSTTQVQFNNAGAFGGSANLTFDGTTLTAAALTSTGVATFSAGSVSAPAITTSGDTNTGIFFPAADTIAFTEGGVEAMRIDSSGNVGIGISDPASYSGRLTVAGNVAASAGNNLRVWDSANTTYVQMNSPANRTVRWTNDAGTEYFRFGSAGQLGIAGANYGSSGQVLTSNGSGSAPSWGSVTMPAGTIIQALQATNNTVYTINGGSGGANLTGMQITITPRNSSSRFLLIASLGQIGQSSGGSTAAFNFTRNGTSLNYISGGSYNGVAAFVDNNTNLSPVMATFSFIDSPATASAITYRITISTDGTKYIGRRGNDDQIRSSQQFQVL